MLSLNQLPLELLLAILRYLDIPDILRIRKVSQYLNEVSHRRGVWTDAYRQADFIRPPGPFLSQSAHDLENALVPSFLVHRNLRQGCDIATQGKIPTPKLKGIRYTGLELDVSLVFGRFLFIAFSDQVCCYDLNIDAIDSTSCASIVYKPPCGRILKSFRSVSAIDVDGRPFACVVLSEAAQAGKPTNISIYSLNVTEISGVTLDLLHQVEHREFINLYVQLGPRVIVVSVCLDIGLHDDYIWDVIALDVHTRTQFLLAPFTWTGREPDETPEWAAMTPLMSISTSTHFLLARSLYIAGAGWNTIFQAFTLPPTNTHEHPVPLDYSHRGIIPGMNIRDVVLLQDAVLDPSTQEVLITIRVHEFKQSDVDYFNSKYGTLRLCKCHDEVGTIAFRLLGSLGRPSQTSFFQSSFNGTGRAFYMFEPSSYGIVAALEYDVHRNDGSEGKIINYPCVLRSRAPCKLLDYDPYSGRICLRYTVLEDKMIEILDFGV